MAAGPQAPRWRCRRSGSPFFSRPAVARPRSSASCRLGGGVCMGGGGTTGTRALAWRARGRAASLGRRRGLPGRCLPGEPRTVPGFDMCHRRGPTRGGGPPGGRLQPRGGRLQPAGVYRPERPSPPPAAAVEFSSKAGSKRLGKGNSDPPPRLGKEQPAGLRHPPPLPQPPLYTHTHTHPAIPGVFAGVWPLAAAVLLPGCGIRILAFPSRVCFIFQLRRSLGV